MKSWDALLKRIGLENGQAPRLLYATRQIVATTAVTRAIHRHDDCTELLFVYQGAGQYVVEGHSYPIRTGDILLYNRGDLHEVTSSAQHEIGTICFGMDGVRLEGLPEGHLTAAACGFVRPTGQEFARFQAICSTIYEYAGEKTPYAREMNRYLLPALVLLAANLPPDARAADQPQHLVLAHRVRQYIGLHFTDPLTLESMGETFRISPYYLSHIFKEVMGMSPIQYMIRCRVGEAQNLLISTDYSATQIAAIVGYSNASHFSAVFSRLVGLPPIRYRRQYLQDMQGKRAQ